MLIDTILHNMSFDLNSVLDANDGLHHYHPHHPQHHHQQHQHLQQHLQPTQHYRSDSIQSDSNCNTSNQSLSLEEQHLLELPRPIPYEFQLPINLFPTQSISNFSPNSNSSSSHSSNSSKHSPFQSQHQLPSLHNHDHDHQYQSPTPLPRTYLSAPLDLIQSSDQSNRESRESRSGSVVSSESNSNSNSNWPVPKSFNASRGPFDLPRWEDEDSHWGIPNFGEDKTIHERSKSESDIEERRSGLIDHKNTTSNPVTNSYTTNSNTNDCLDLSFNFTTCSRGEYLNRNQSFNLNRSQNQVQTQTQAWSRDDDSLIESNDDDDDSNFDPSLSKFVLRTLPSSESSHQHHGLNDRLINSSSNSNSNDHEGPVLASFSLPPTTEKLSESSRTTILSKRPRSQSNQNSSQSFASTTTTTMIPDLSIKNTNLKTKKATSNRTPRAGNNGGRCRRLAPATRECKVCGAKFTRNDRLKYHTESIHEHKEPEFKCKEMNCSKAFRQKSDLVRHLKFVHRKTPQINK